MGLPIILSKNEKYYCEHCQKEFQYSEVYKSWKCPVCDERISIRVEIEKFVHNCYRVTPEELKIGELVTLDCKNIHAILALEKNGSEYRIALQNYRVITVDNTQIFSKIDGVWTDK